MKFKKLVSAVSALALSVTAFAGLMGTAEAATPAFTQDFTVNEAGSTDPADYGFTNANSAATATGCAYSVSDGVFSITAQSNNGNSRGYEFIANFTPIESGNMVNVSYTWATGSATGHNIKSYASTYLADSNGNKIFEVRYNGQPEQLYVNDVNVASIERNGTHNVTATIDMNTKKITTLSVGDAYTIKEPIDFLSTDATNAAKFGFNHVTGSVDWANTSYIDNVNISYDVARTPVSSANIQYKTSNGDVIETISLDNVYDNNYAQKSVDGIYTGDQYYVPFQKYIFKDGVLYETAHTDADPHYGILTTFTENTVLERTVSIVTPAEGTEFIAVVDCDGDTSNYASIRGSNMSAARGDITLTENVTPGIYSITYNQYIRGADPKLYLNDVYVCDLDIHEKSWGEATTNNIKITEAGTLTIKSIDMTDYILLTKTGELTPTVTALDDTSEAAAIEYSGTATAVEEGAEALTLDGTEEVYTMWIKTENCEDTYPTIILKQGETVIDSNVQITQADTVDSGENAGYFCVQILKEGLEAGDYTATFASDGASCDVTFTVAE